MDYFQFLAHVILALGGPHTWGARTFVNLGIAFLIFTPFIPVVASVFFCATEERKSQDTVFAFFVAAVLAYTASKFCTEPRCVPSHKTDGKGLSRRVRFGKAMLELDNSGWV